MPKMDWMKVIARLDAEVTKHQDAAQRQLNDGNTQAAHGQIIVADVLLSISWSLQNGLHH